MIAERSRGILQYTQIPVYRDEDSYTQMLEIYSPWRSARYLLANNHPTTQYTGLTSSASVYPHIEAL